MDHLGHFCGILGIYKGQIYVLIFKKLVRSKKKCWYKKVFGVKSIWEEKSFRELSVLGKTIFNLHEAQRDPIVIKGHQHTARVNLYPKDPTKPSRGARRKGA